MPKIKSWTVVIDYIRNNPKTKKKENQTRSWTFVQALTAIEAIEKCKKQTDANEAGNNPIYTHKEAAEIK